MRLKKGRKTMNFKIVPEFGQKWNYERLKNADNLWFALRKAWKNEDSINKLYEMIVKLNPKLKKIRVDTSWKKRAVLGGIASGLHYNDIKYYVQKLKLNLKYEEKRINKLLRGIATLVFGVRCFLFQKTKSKEPNIEFTLSPET